MLKIKFQKGYTLVEILAATAIFSGMMIIAVGTFSLASSNDLSSATKRIVNQSAKNTVDALIQEISLSRNIYDSNTETIMPGYGAYVIANKPGNNTAPAVIPTDTATVEQADLTDPTKMKEVKGNALVVFSTDSNRVRQTKAYYLCQHPDEPTMFALGYKVLSSFSGPSAHYAGVNKDNIENQMICDASWEPLTSPEVAIINGSDLGNGDFIIRGTYPEQGLLVQPSVNISLTINNRFGDNRADEFAVSTYRANIVHRDYGATTLP